jgi:hypothetical protein
MKKPINAPCVSIASNAYWEQVGWYLQEGGRTGEINLL